MEGRRIFWTILTGFAISLVIVVGTMTYTTKQKKTQAQEKLSDVVTDSGESGEAQPQDTLGYTMWIVDGQIGLFRSGCSTPYRKLDMPLSLLSENDLAALEESITVETQRELDQMIEDYTS